MDSVFNYDLFLDHANECLQCHDTLGFDGTRSVCELGAFLLSGGENALDSHYTQKQNQ